MTARQRLTAIASGTANGTKPTVAWPGNDASSDVVIVSSPSEIDTKRDPDKLILVEVSNPFGLALQAGVDLNQAQKDDPVAGGAKLAEFTAKTKAAISAALSAGADGILYKLYGATEQFCTPMQYGGYYLEIDREILAEAEPATFNLLYIVGDADTFIDFVSDLPAHAFAWDIQSTGFSVSAVRELRPGALCANDPEADILLQTATGKETTAQFLTLQVNGSHA
ncbi:MAG: hypothetical protein KF784_02775 [Fimbriimonadaceae bacterium]|nr:hypothetical protein [Fimbriimonadaceae bacterium]